MRIDIVICTYNRKGKLLQLIGQLNQCNPTPSGIIVVDSSDISIKEALKYDLVKYVISDRKNQPFQRYLGYLESTADILVYLDDDMEIIDKEFLVDINKSFISNENLAGLALNFEDKYPESSLSFSPKSGLLKKNKKIKEIINWFTGYPKLQIGKFGMNGNRGKQPSKGGVTEWLSGGSFAAKRDKIFKNFNFQLFDLFENGLGMGEDAIIGYTLSKQGELYYSPKLLFYHNDQKDSSYSLDLFMFSRRVIFSRLYLSLEKCRLDNKTIVIGYISFYWYSFWRVLGLTLNYFIDTSIERKLILMGSLNGWGKTISFSFQKKNFTI